MAAATALLLGGVLPAAAGAADLSTSGGASLTGSPGATSAPSPVSQVAPGPVPQAVNGTISTSGNGFTLDATESGLTTHEITFSGIAPAADTGQTIELERAPSGAAPGSTWTQTAEAVVGSGGAFSIPWRAAQGGQFEFRAIIASARAQEPVSINDAAGGAVGLPTATATAASQTPTATASAASPPLTVTIFKAALATIYGPGLYGHHTACGQILRKTTIGVASRTLKCGTKVSIYYKGRELSVPVIDRGPYGSSGAKWDLTMATATAIGVTTTSTIGTLS